MENNLSNGAQRVFKKAAFLQMATDLYGKHRYEVPDLLQLYFDTRILAPWSKVEQKVLQPFFMYVHNKIAMFGSTTDLEKALTYKSALVFMAGDFADLADTLLYSSTMEYFDSVIGTLRYHINSLDKICAIRDMSCRPMLQNHTWWCLLDDVTTLNGEPIREYQRALAFIVDHAVVDRFITRKCETLTEDIIWDKKTLLKQKLEETQRRNRYQIKTEENIFKDETQRDLMLSTIEPAGLARTEFAKTARALDAANAKVLLLVSAAKFERREVLKMFKHANWVRIQAEEVQMNLLGFKTFPEMVKNCW